MIDTDSYKTLMDALSRVLKHLPGELAEADSDEDTKTSKDSPEAPKGHSISILTVGKEPHGAVKIPKLSTKAGKKGGKGE